MSDTESAIEIQRNIQGEVTEDDRCDRPMRIYAFRSVRSRPKGSPATDSGVQRTEPLAVPPHLGRRVGRVHDDRLAADREFLMELNL